MIKKVMIFFLFLSIREKIFCLINKDLLPPWFFFCFFLRLLFYIQSISIA